MSLALDVNESHISVIAGPPTHSLGASIVLHAVRLSSSSVGVCNVPRRKILFRKFTWRHRLTLLFSNVVQFVRREIDEIVRYLPYKKFRLPLKLSLLRGSRPKPTRASRQHLAHNIPNFVQISSLSAELKPNAVLLDH